MNFFPIKTSLLVASATLLLAAPPAQATLTYAPDQLFLGFHQDGNTTKEYVVNLGLAGTFRDAVTPFTLSLGATALAADLQLAFGMNWRTAGTVHWGVVGTPGQTGAGGDTARLVYVSEPASSATPGDSLPPTASSGQSGPVGNILTFKNYWLTGTEGSVGNAGIESPGDVNSWTGYVATGFGSGNLLPVESLLNNPLDLYRVPQTSNQALVTNEGRFAINLVTDTITFTPYIVPEPTAGAMLGVALASLGLLRHRRKPTKA